MTRKERQIIIDKVLMYYRIEEKMKNIYFNNKTGKTKKSYEKARNQHVAMEILANNLGINIFNGIVGGANKDYMQVMKRV